MLMPSLQKRKNFPFNPIINFATVDLYLKKKKRTPNKYGNSNKRIKKICVLVHHSSLRLIQTLLHQLRLGQLPHSTRTSSATAYGLSDIIVSRNSRLKKPNGLTCFNNQ
jgi:hypothetical protein